MWQATCGVRYVAANILKAWQQTTANVHSADVSLVPRRCEVFCTVFTLRKRYCRLISNLYALVLDSLELLNSDVHIYFCLTTFQ